MALVSTCDCRRIIPFIRFPPGGRCRLRHERPGRHGAARSDRGDRHALIGYPEAVTSVLAVFQVLIVFVLVALILMHSGRDAGMGGMGFTPASQGGTHIVEGNLTRFTIVMGVLFFVNSIALFHFLK